MITFVSVKKNNFSSKKLILIDNNIFSGGLKTERKMPSELSPFIEALRKKACTKTANKDPTKLFDYLNKIKKEAERSMLQEKYNDAYVYYYRWKHLVDFLKTAMKKDEKKLNLYYARIPSISEVYFTLVASNLFVFNLKCS